MGTDRADDAYRSHLLKPRRLIYIGAAAFGEAKKQPTTLASASPLAIVTSKGAVPIEHRSKGSYPMQQVQVTLPPKPSLTDVLSITEGF